MFTTTHQHHIFVTANWLFGTYCNTSLMWVWLWGIPIRLVGQLSGLEQRQEEQRAEWEGRVKQAEKMADSRQQELLRQLTSKSGEVSVASGLQDV